LDHGGRSAIILDLYPFYEGGRGPPRADSTQIFFQSQDSAPHACLRIAVDFFEHRSVHDIFKPLEMISISDFFPASWEFNPHTAGRNL
jgi:hypothetical protein